MHTTFTFMHLAIIVAVLLLLLMIILRVKNIKISKQTLLYALVISIVIVSLTLFYYEERTSGMGYLKTFGYPKAFFQTWNDFKNIENNNSFNIISFLGDWIIYFLTSLIALLLIKKK